MQDCPTCGTVYCIIPDDDPPFIRTTCECEADRMCQNHKRCTQRATQAYLRHNGETVFSYRCKDHGQDVFAETKLQLNVEGIRTGRLSSGVTNTPKMSNLSDEMLFSTLEEQLRKEAPDKTTVLRCTFCKIEHTPAKRKWVRSHENGRRCLSSTCPKCKYTGYASVL